MSLFDQLEQISPSPGQKNTPDPAQTRKKYVPKQAKLPKKPRQKRKPERLSFLFPCPICQGTSFVHGNAGGFYCKTCQPGIEGHLVEATGKNKPERITTKAAAGDDQIPGPKPMDRAGELQQQAFAVAWPWIKENKAQLLSAGWTMAALVRRGKFKWPYGKWGVAWLSVWIREGATFSLGSRGEIIFSFQNNGKTVKQTAFPF